mgnify:CR=1 FL=1
MKIYTQKDLKANNIKEWSSFVNAHPEGNIFQTPEIVRVYCSTKYYTPVAYFAYENNELVGVLVGVIQKEYNGILGFLSSRCIVMGGPLSKHNNSEIINGLLKHFNNNIKSKVIYSQIRNLFDITSREKTFENNGFRYEAHLDIKINLNDDPDNYWLTLKSKLRQKIRKSIKSNLHFEFIESKEDLYQGYIILREVYSNAKLPIPDYSLFLSAFEILREENKAAFFKAEQNGVIIGVRFVLNYKNLIYDWYAGSKKEYYKYNPNEFLPYKVITWGMDNPLYSMFDFGGAGNPNKPYGVRDHKLKFSDNLIELGRFEKIHHRFIYIIIKIVFKFWRKFLK